MKTFRGMETLTRLEQYELHTNQTRPERARRSVAAPALRKLRWAKWLEAENSLAQRNHYAREDERVGNDAQIAAPEMA